MIVEPTRRSPLARAHVALGATWAREGDWELPAAYGDPAAEAARLTGSVGIADITPRAKIDVRGSIDGALGATADALVARISDDWALVLGDPGAEEQLLPKLEGAAGTGCMVTDATHLFAGFALAGPRLADLLARLTSWDSATLAPGFAAGVPIAEVRGVVVRRGPDTMEAYVATEFGRYAWETIVGAGERLGGGPVGWTALRETGWR